MLFYPSYVILRNFHLWRAHNLDTVVRAIHIAATYRSQPLWGALHNSTIAVSSDPLFPPEGLASETTPVDSSHIICFSCSVFSVRLLVHNLCAMLSVCQSYGAGFYRKYSQCAVPANAWNGAVHMHSGEKLEL